MNSDSRFEIGEFHYQTLKDDLTSFCENNPDSTFALERIYDLLDIS